jgi:hypothetical protein
LVHQSGFSDLIILITNLILQIRMIAERSFKRVKKSSCLGGSIEMATERPEDKV